MEWLPQKWKEMRLVHHWQYKNKAGELIGVTARYETNNGEKNVIPFFKPHGAIFKAGGPNGPKPIFGIERLNPNKAVLVVEGEKCASALHSLGFNGVTWLGGCKQAQKADWSQLKGFKSFILLPDNDEQGQAAMSILAGILSELPGKPQVKFANLPGLSPKGDVIDFLRSSLEEQA